MNNLRDKILEFIKGLSRGAKIGLIVGAVLFVVVIALLIMLFTRVEYSVVASGLSLEDAAKVTKKLDELGIPWREERIGQISVPSTQVSRSRMELAVSVATDNITYNDIFQNDTITRTAQSREEMYIQAKATEIRGAIETISSVKKAKVLLQIPKESNFFINEDVDSKASIVLELNSSNGLSEEQVSGIVNLVINSVKGLKPENVTIIDSSGVQLNRPYSGDFLAGSQIDLQNRMEEKLRIDTTYFLEKMYGRGNVEVKPSIKLNFDRETYTRTEFSPPIDGETNGIARSVNTINENVNNNNLAAGAPGTDTNTGEATNITQTGDGTAAYIKASETYNYELNEVKQQIIRAEGTVTELKIAVLLNTKALVNNTLTDVHKAELINLIAVSAGTPATNVSVLAYEFPDPASVYDMIADGVGSGSGSLLTGVSTNMLILVIAIVVLLFVIIAMLLLQRSKKKREEELKAIEEMQRTVDEANQNEDEESEDFEIGIKEDKGSPKYHIEKFVDKNPEAAVQLLRAWFNEN